MSESPAHPPTPASLTGGAPIVWAIGPAFLVVAAVLLFAVPPADVPRGDLTIVPTERFAPERRARSMTTPPAVIVGGFPHNCNECHRTFSTRGDDRTLVQHTNIVFNHGMNDRCFNCHDREDRELLVLYDGTRIGFDQVPRLCAQCHGTVYRDWQRGTHGKTMGSWDAAGGGQYRLDCNDCHNPHSPAYRPVPPLPGPSTLRMGETEPRHELAPHHMPLRRPDHGPARPEIPPGHPQEGRP